MAQLLAGWWQECGRNADSLQTKCGHLFSLADLARTAWSLPCCTRAVMAAEDISCNVVSELRSLIFLFLSCVSRDKHNCRSQSIEAG